jgi:hypothetical protein
MAPYLPIYSNNLLDQLRKGQKLKQELSDEILRVLLSDSDVQELIRDRTWDKYQELVRRSSSR